MNGFSTVLTTSPSDTSKEVTNYSKCKISLHLWPCRFGGAFFNINKTISAIEINQIRKLGSESLFDTNKDGHIVVLRPQPHWNQQ